MPLFHSQHIMGEPITGDLAEKLGLDNAQEILKQQRQNEEDLEFHDLPPFPEDVPTAPLLRLSLKKLQQGEDEEVERLWRACCDLGFFYLDLRESGEELLKTTERLFELGEKVFDASQEEKDKFDFVREGNYFGYKGPGEQEGNRNEFWNVSKDDVLGISQRLPNPPVLTDEENRALMKAYMLQSHEIVTLILQLLNDKLGFPPSTIQDLHRLSAVSGDQLRWVKSPPQPPTSTALGAHTDFGSVTILFNRLGGLQVHPPSTSEWSYVKPLKGHCIVNLGDAMVKFTAGVLRSNLHRVVRPPGMQGELTRMSLVYFARPEDEVKLRVVEGSEVVGEWEEEGEAMTAKEWILKRAMQRRGVGDQSVEMDTVRKSK